MMFNSAMYEIMSIVLIFCFGFSLITDSVNTMWRIFFDIKLSVVLTKLEGIHEEIIRMNVVRPMKIKINWILAITVFIHCLFNNCRQIRLMIDINYIGVINMVIINKNRIIKHV